MFNSKTVNGKILYKIPEDICRKMLQFEVIAITGSNCHICKQLIYENSLRSGIDVVIIMEEEGKIKQIPISTMMPYPWPVKPTV